MSKIALAVLAVIVILASVGTYFFSQSIALKLAEANESDQVQIQEYQARKEDLVASQEKLEMIMEQLNATLNAALERQNQLNEELANLSGEAAKPLPVINTTKIVKVPGL